MAQRQIVETFCTCSSLSSSCLFLFDFASLKNPFDFLVYGTLISIPQRTQIDIDIYTDKYTHILHTNFSLSALLISTLLLSLRVCCENIFRQFRWYSFCSCFTHFTCSPALPLFPFLHSSLISPEYIKSMFIRYRKCVCKKTKIIYTFFLLQCSCG